MEPTDPWLVRTGSQSSGSTRLFCFPYAGGSAIVYRRWSRVLPAEVEVIPVELPGRGNRIKEQPFRRIPQLVRELAETVSTFVGRRFAFFGHSMGAVIAFELARELRRQGLMEPRCLFVSGRRAPQIRETDPPTYDLPQSEFISELHRLNGTPKEVLENEELMSVVLPLLRADFELIQTYEYKDDAPLNCPMAAYGGTGDYEVPTEMLLPWKDQTTGPFGLHMLEGDHFFLRSCEADLLALVREELMKVRSQESSYVRGST